MQGFIEHIHRMYSSATFPTCMVEGRLPISYLAEGENSPISIH